MLVCLLAEGVFCQSSQKDFAIHAPTNIDSLQSMTVWASYYYMHQFTSGGNIEIVDANGNPTGLYADTCNFCEAVLSGSAMVKDSNGKKRRINYAGRGTVSRVDCRKCEKLAHGGLNVDSWGRAVWNVSAGFGKGVGSYKLIPYRTIAVDKNTIPYGTILFIPAARGVRITLPGGKKTVHDGYFFAADKGGAVHNNHIDIFTGTHRSNPFKNFATSNKNRTVDAYIVTEKPVVDLITKIQTR